MIAGTAADDARALRIGRMPVPHEHGAWVMLYAPPAIVFAVARPFTPIADLLLLIALTSAFLAREAAGLLIRGRGREGTGFWLGLYTAILGASALPLFVVYHRYSLLAVGLLAAILFTVHSRLLTIPSRKRLDRSQWGEILGVGALALTAPAAYAVAVGHLDARAWLIWVACALYFSSGIFSVKMLLSAVKFKQGFPARERWVIGRDNLAYHVLLLPAITLMAWRIGGWPGALLAAGYVPALWRAFYTTATLTNRLPSLKRMGMVESLRSLWFMGCIIAALLATR